MQIDQLPGLEPSHMSRLAAIGICSCRQLLRACRRQDGFARMVETAGLSPEALQRIVQWSELCQIRGVGPSTFENLLRIGIDSVSRLAEQDPAELQMLLKHESARPPNLAVLEDWISQAQRSLGVRMTYPYPRYST